MKSSHSVTLLLTMGYIAISKIVTDEDEKIDDDFNLETKSST